LISSLSFYAKEGFHKPADQSKKLSKRPVYSASCCRRVWILDLDPSLRRTRFINGRKPLRHDALKPEIANGGKKFVAVALSVLDILDALSRFAQHPF
jgi:hypothetical protein